MSIANVLSLLGGVALFLFGITLMGEGLNRVAGNKLELILYRLSGTPLKALLLGTGVTAVIQSSSATSVMVVGFVNSGMMKLRQAVHVILGALIGTSITGWIICLSSLEGVGGWVSLLSTATITSVVAIVGIVLRMFSKKQIKRHLGDILLGFSVLMYGMQVMSGAVAPLKESAQFTQMMTTFSNPLLGILFGAAFTAVLQSASAAVGILQALSMTGAIQFATAYPIILGIAIGAAVPVLLSALGAKEDGRKAAWSYLTIEVLGVALCGLIYYQGVARAFPDLSGWVMNPVSIAAVNTLFRVVTAILLMPFDKQIIQLSSLFVKHGTKPHAEECKDLDRLDERFLQHPALAVEQSRHTMIVMANLAFANTKTAMKMLVNYSDEKRQQLDENEAQVDLFEDRVSTYLLKMNTQELSPALNEKVSRYLRALSDLERISDHAINVSESATELHEKEIVFSSKAQKELSVISAAVTEIMRLTIAAFNEDDAQKAYRVSPLEERIDILCEEIKQRHVDRLKEGKCQLTQGFVFNDLLTDYERIADHCYNIAIAMIEVDSGCYDTHKLKDMRLHDFDRHYQEYEAEYQI